MGCNTDEAIYISVVLMSILNLQTVQRRHVGGQKAHAKSLTSGKLTLMMNGLHQKCKQYSSERVWTKGTPSFTIGGNVNWYNQYGEHYGGSLKNLKYSYHMIQQSYSWAYIQRKP